MDYLLDIIILRKEIDNCGLKELLMEWGGTMHSISPAVYVTDSKIEFMEVENKSYYNRIIGKSFENDYICLHLKSNIIFDFEYSVNTHNYKKEDDKLLAFLKRLYRLSCFYLLLIREDEKIQNIFEIGCADEIESILIKSVDWSEPKDVLLYKLARQ